MKGSREEEREEEGTHFVEVASDQGVFIEYLLFQFGDQ